MKYLVTYTTGNGEWCHCHRVTSDQTEEYGDLDSIAVSMLDKWKSYGGDLSIDTIYEVEEVDEGSIERVKDCFKRLTVKATEAKELHRKEDKEKEERHLLTRLKDKYKKQDSKEV